MCMLSVFEELAFLQRQKATNRHGTAVDWIVEDETQCQQGVVGRGSPFSDVLELKSPCFFNAKVWPPAAQKNAWSRNPFGQQRLLYSKPVRDLGQRDLRSIETLEANRARAWALCMASHGFYIAQIPRTRSLTYTQIRTILMELEC